MSNTLFIQRLSKAAMLSLLLQGCALPASMPMRGQIERGADYPVVMVDRALAQQLSKRSQEQFGKEFTQLSVIDVDRVYSGDKLSFQIFENVDAGLFGTPGQAPVVIGPVEVDGKGMIVLPYAGKVRASGRRLEDLRAELEEKLAQQTPNPQVIGMREPSGSLVVTVSGNAASGGVVPLDYGRRNLRAVLAASGIAPQDPTLLLVEVTRGGKIGKATLDAVQSIPQQDIALRPGDVITVTAIKPSVALLGASSTQGAFDLDRSDESLASALARAGGLNSNSGDAKGLFVMRSVNASTGADKPTIFAFDLTQPEGIFASEAFTLEDGDVVYVSEVGVSRAGRAVRALLGIAQPVDQINNIGR